MKIVFYILSLIFSLSTICGEPSKILITNINIFDGKTARLKRNFNVLIVGNKISKISKNIKEGKDTLVIDGKQSTLMPGLIDAHAHVMLAGDFHKIEDDYTVGDLHVMAVAAAKTILMDGFTTIRDMGGPTFGLKRGIDSGRVLGPRIYPSGAMISQTSGHGDFRSRADPNPTLSGKNVTNFSRFGLIIVADGNKDVLAATRQNLMQGASQIKIMGGGGGASRYDPIDTTQYSLSEMKAVVGAAEDWGTYVCAHIFTDRAINRALKAGIKCFEHGFFMSSKVMKKVAKFKGWVVPQMWGISPELFNNPAVTKSKHPALKAMQKKYKDFAPNLLKYEVNVAFASDFCCGSIGNATNARRYELYWRTKAFKSNFEVLKQATSKAGELLAMSGPRNPYPGKLGVIEKGAYADILLVEGNPLKNIMVLGANKSWFDQADPKPIKTLKLIIKDGKIYKNTL